MTWREELRPIVAGIIERVGRDDMKALRKALAERGKRFRGLWPYKVWCDEVNEQLGIKAAKKAAQKAATEAAKGPGLFD